MDCKIFCLFQLKNFHIWLHFISFCCSATSWKYSFNSVDGHSFDHMVRRSFFCITLRQVHVSLLARLSTVCDLSTCTCSLKIMCRSYQPAIQLYTGKVSSKLTEMKISSAVSYFSESVIKLLNHFYWGVS